MEKGTSIKSPTGGSPSSPSAPQAGFGIGGFVGTGGTVGPAAASGNEYTLPMPKPACGADGDDGLPPVGLFMDVPFSMVFLISSITRTARKLSAEVETRYSPILIKNSLSPILPCL